MNKAKSLEECIQSLRELRAKIHQHSDASVMQELDRVITTLETLASEKKAGMKLDRVTVMNALLTIVKIVNAVSNLESLIKVFLDGVK